MKSYCENKKKKMRLKLHFKNTNKQLSHTKGRATFHVKKEGKRREERTIRKEVKSKKQKSDGHYFQKIN